MAGAELAGVLVEEVEHEEAAVVAASELAAQPVVLEEVLAAV